MSGAEGRTDEAIRTGACDHEVGICWGKPLPTPAEVAAMQAQRHVEAGCAHALGVCQLEDPR